MTTPAERDDPVLAATPDAFHRETRRALTAVFAVLALTASVLLVVAVASFTDLRRDVASTEPPAVAVAVAVGAVLLPTWLLAYAVTGLRTRTARWRRRETDAVLVRRRRRHPGGPDAAAALHATYSRDDPARFPPRPAWFRRGDVVVTTYADVPANVLLVSVVARTAAGPVPLPLVRRDGWAATRYGAPPESGADATGPVSST